MIYRIYKTSRFNKSLKRYRHDQDVLSELEKVLDFLAEDGFIPSKYHPHNLVGKFRSSFECHVRPNLLLVYCAPNENGIIYVDDIGSHSQIFG